MPYVLRRDRDGKFVGANPGVTGNSYVWALQDAKNWPTREAAKAEACGNEYVVDVANVMAPSSR